MKISIDVRRIENQDKLFINDELFDWELDEDSIQKVNEIEDKEELIKIHENIKSYFLSCVEELTQKKITIKELIEGIKNGYIEL
jgi:transcription termination factor NusB